MRFVVAVALLATLSACAGEPTPKEPTSTPSATPTPTLAAPTMPPQASEPGPEGIAAFVDHWIDQLNYASNTGDVHGLQAVSSDTCRTCNNYVELYRSTYAAGGFFRDSDWEASDIEVGQRPNWGYAKVSISADAGTYRTSDTSSESGGDPEDFVAEFKLSRSKDNWRVYEVTKEDS